MGLKQSDCIHTLDLKLSAVNFDPYHEHAANSISYLDQNNFNTTLNNNFDPCKNWIIILTNLKAYSDKYPQMTYY